MEIHTQLYLSKLFIHDAPRCKDIAQVYTMACMKQQLLNKSIHDYPIRLYQILKINRCPAVAVGQNAVCQEGSRCVTEYELQGMYTLLSSVNKALYQISQ